MKRRFLSFFVALAAVLALASFFPGDASAEGLKKVVAVSRFENNSSWGGQWALDTGMADQLTDALMQSGQFVVLERETLGDVMAEQDLAASGRAMQSKSAQTGKITSAQILIKGAVTEFEDGSSGSGTGIGIKGVKIGMRRGEAHVGLIIRLINSTTGEVLASERVEGTAKAGGFDLGLDIGSVDFGTSSFKKMPLGKATQIAIDNAVEIIAEKLRAVPYQGRIVKVAGDDVYVSAGEKAGAKVGDEFTVFSVGEELVDPETGEILGAEESAVGRVKIYQVMEKFSKAKAVGSLGAVNSGDIIRQ
jgi:curli biogenesis system outer membrane secretion channel CsgG